MAPPDEHPLRDGFKDGVAVLDRNAAQLRRSRGMFPVTGWTLANLALGNRQARATAKEGAAAIARDAAQLDVPGLKAKLGLVHLRPRTVLRAVRNDPAAKRELRSKTRVLAKNAVILAGTRPKWVRFLFDLRP